MRRTLLVVGSLLAIAACAQQPPPPPPVAANPPPPPPPPPPPVYTVYFDYNSSLLTPSGREIIRLAADSYKHKNKNFGWVDVPEFSVTGWTGASDNFAPRAGGDFEEDIPF